MPQVCFGASSKVIYISGLLRFFTKRLGIMLDASWSSILMLCKTMIIVGERIFCHAIGASVLSM